MGFGSMQVSCKSPGALRSLMWYRFSVQINLVLWHILLAFYRLLGFSSDMHTLATNYLELTQKGNCTS